MCQVTSKPSSDPPMGDPWGGLGVMGPSELSCSSMGDGTSSGAPSPSDGLLGAEQSTGLVVPCLCEPPHLNEHKQPRFPSSPAPPGLWTLCTASFHGCSQSADRAQEPEPAVAGGKRTGSLEMQRIGGGGGGRG